MSERVVSVIRAPSIFHSLRVFNTTTAAKYRGLNSRVIVYRRNMNRPLLQDITTEHCSLVLYSVYTTQTKHCSILLDYNYQRCPIKERTVCHVTTHLRCHGNACCWYSARCILQLPSRVSGAKLSALAGSWVQNNNDMTRFTRQPDAKSSLCGLPE